MSRTLIFTVFRHNPRDPGDAPRTQAYRLDETPGMTLFIALTRIREEQDPSLNYAFVSPSAVCATCAMVLNGRPPLACPGPALPGRRHQRRRHPHRPLRHARRLPARHRAHRRH